jgi:hypothetical protein
LAADHEHVTADLNRSAELTRVIRPAAVVPESAATRIVAELGERDVSAGGVWNASPTVWQRYSAPWDGPGATRGSAVLVGTVAVAYGTPLRHHITVYRVTISEAGAALGWTVDQLCDEALGYGGLTLAECPRAELAAPPVPDPFHLKR